MGHWWGSKRQREHSLCVSDKDLNIEDFEEAIRGLLAFKEAAYAEENTICKPLGTLAASMALILTAPLNHINEKPMRHKITMSNSGVMNSVMPVINRSFFSQVLIQLEKIYKEICDDKQIEIPVSGNRRLESILKGINKKLNEKEKEKIKDEIDKLEEASSYPIPYIDDYLEALLEHSSLDKDNKKKHRKLLMALKICRNKSSHLDTVLTAQEIESINIADLNALLRDDALVINPNHFKEICLTVANFVSHLKDNLKS